MLRMLRMLRILRVACVACDRPVLSWKTCVFLGAAWGEELLMIWCCTEDVWYVYWFLTKTCEFLVMEFRCMIIVVVHDWYIGLCIETPRGVWPHVRLLPMPCVRLVLITPRKYGELPFTISSWQRIEVELQKLFGFRPRISLGKPCCNSTYWIHVEARNDYNLIQTSCCIKPIKIWASCTGSQTWRRAVVRMVFLEDRSTDSIANSLVKESLWEKSSVRLSQKFIWITDIPSILEALLSSRD
jgi:hypothetical protein